MVLIDLDFRGPLELKRCRSSETGLPARWLVPFSSWYHQVRTVCESGPPGTLLGMVLIWPWTSGSFVEKNPVRLGSNLSAWWFVTFSLSKFPPSAYTGTLRGPMENRVDWLWLSRSFRLSSLNLVTRWSLVDIRCNYIWSNLTLTFKVLFVSLTFSLNADVG